MPAFGIVTTTGLILLVCNCLLTGVQISEADLNQLTVRSPAERKDSDKKESENKEPESKSKNVSARMIGVGPVVELGKANEVVESYPKRSKNLDVKARILTYLTTWAAFNLVQAAVTAVVLFLSFRLLMKYWNVTERLIFVLALLLNGACAVAVVVGDDFGLAPVAVPHSVSGQLQDLAREYMGIKTRIDRLTDIGNISIVTVVVLVPSTLCLVLSSAACAKERYEDLQLLMFWTAFLDVASVVQVTYQNRMPALFFDDEFNVQIIYQMASGTGLLIGGLFTVALGLVFLPASYWLQSKIEHGGDECEKGWLAQILAVLAPVVTAIPVGKLFDITS